MPAKGQTKFTEALGEEICDRIANGESIRKIAASDHMPDVATIMRWLDADVAFAHKYARARDIQGDYMDALVLDTAEASTPATAASDRVKIDAYKWRAAKLKPKKYGDRTHHELTGANGGPIRTQELSHYSDERLAALAALIGADTDARGSTSGDPEASSAEGA